MHKKKTIALGIVVLIALLLCAEVIFAPVRSHQLLRELEEAPWWKAIPMHFSRLANCGVCGRRKARRWLATFRKDTTMTYYLMHWDKELFVGLSRQEIMDVLGDPEIQGDDFIGYTRYPHDGNLVVVEFEDDASVALGDPDSYVSGVAPSDYPYPLRRDYSTLSESIWESDKEHSNQRIQPTGLVPGS